jgi:hypothetical protein
MRNLLSYFFAFFLVYSVSASPDSLLIRLNKAKSDSERVEIIYRAAIKKKNSASRTDSLLSLLAGFKNSPECGARAYSFIKTGTYYANNESPQKAIQNLLQGLKLADSCKNKRAIMQARGRIAFVYKLNKNFKGAIQNAHLSLGIARVLRDSSCLSDNYTLLGNIYKTDMLLDSALHYHTEALKIREKQNDLVGMALTYNNLGLVYKNMNDNSKALFYLRKSLQIKIEIKDKTIFSAYNNLSIVFKRMSLFDSAVIYAQKVIDAGIKQKSSRALTEGVSAIAEAYDEKKDVPRALYYFKRLRVIEDSVNKENLNALHLELESKYESDKKDAELRLKEESLKTAEAVNSRKNILIVLSFIAFAMALIAGVVVFRSYRLSRENARQLETKNALIAEKNKEITDSINYARNIQQSLLTSEQVFKENLQDHFILYLPKDIVSGDFYWAEKRNNEFVIMCADCTGHGVPGAFMSLLGISYLK